MLPKCLLTIVLKYLDGSDIMRVFESDNIPLIKIYINHGKNHENYLWKSLVYACLNNKIKLLKYLWTVKTINQYNCYEIVSIAIEKNYYEIVAFILLSYNKEVLNDWYENIINDAIQYKRSKILYYVLKNLENNKIKKKDRVYMKICENGDKKSVEILKRKFNYKI
jgi:hypothetical protein